MKVGKIFSSSKNIVIFVLSIIRIYIFSKKQPSIIKLAFNQLISGETIADIIINNKTYFTIF